MNDYKIGMNNLKKETLALVEKMEQNTFLLPDKFSDYIQMHSKDIVYKTYVGTRGADRYINFTITDQKNVFEIGVRNNDIQISQSIYKKRLTPKKAYEYIHDIYIEKHSFIENAEGIKSLRKELRENRKHIQELKDKNKKLEKQIKDGLSIKSKI